MKKSLLLLVLLSNYALAAETIGEVFKTATCGCCHKWMEHAEEEGLKLTSEDLEYNSLVAKKTALNIPATAQSCHTTVIDGYVFEGHVPAADIKKFLTDKPEGAIGLAVPGMPAGSPGMETGFSMNYTVLQLNKDGSSSVFNEY